MIVGQVAMFMYTAAVFLYPIKCSRLFPIECFEEELCYFSPSSKYNVKCRYKDIVHL